MKSEGEAITRVDLDFYVRNAEFKWFRENIIEELNSTSSRPELLRYLRKVAGINWLSEWLEPILEKHVARAR